MDVLALFGPTAVGKTGVAIAVAERLRDRGEDPVAISCDAIQVYRGLEVLSGAASASELSRLEHRLLGQRLGPQQPGPVVAGGAQRGQIDEVLDAGPLGRRDHPPGRDAG